MAASVRTVGDITYFYETKRVRNLNLRVTKEGEIKVSAPARYGVLRADAFVLSKRQWILKARQRMLQRLAEQAEPLPDRAEALALFIRLSDEVFPLFASVLGGEKPTIKVRDMTTRWGVCVPSKKQITFSLRLASRPVDQIQYVVLHEYCHFIHPNHQKEFWQLMLRLMPDCMQRRRALRTAHEGSRPAEE